MLKGVLKLNLSSVLRQWHTYIGLFIAPSVLFFAVTGAIQLFSLHEAHGDYTPADIVEKLSAVHKDQVFRKPPDRKPHAPTPESTPPAGQAAQQALAQGDDRGVSRLLLKWFFLFVAAGLILSTCFGIWMGLTNPRRRMVGGILLIAGSLIPLCLLAA